MFVHVCVLNFDQGESAMVITIIAGPSPIPAFYAEEVILVK